MKMIKELIKLANVLDSRGLVKEADYFDALINSALSKRGSIKTFDPPPPPPGSDSWMPAWSPADELKRTMKGFGTKEAKFWELTNALINPGAHREYRKMRHWTDEATIEAVKRNFEEKYGSLKRHIKGDFRGRERRRALKAWNL
jgi:hypothetical protein